METRFPDQGQRVEHRVQNRDDEASICQFVSCILLALWSLFSKYVIFVIICCFMPDYEKSLESDVCGDTSAMFRRVLVSLLTVSPRLCQKSTSRTFSRPRAWCFLTQLAQTPKFASLHNFPLNFTSAVLQAGRDESDTVDEAQAVVDAKARAFLHVCTSHFGPFW